MAARVGGRAVIGTTGFAAAQREEIERLATQIPIMLSPNMSVAVNVAFRVLAEMARMLGDDYDVEVTEVHHRFKKDAPSGTAARMAEIVAGALGRDLTKAGVYGRHGLPGERTRQEIGIHSIRSGDVGRGAHGQLRQPGRAPGADAPRAEPRHLRARRAPRGEVHRARQARRSTR